MKKQKKKDNLTTSEAIKLVIKAISLLNVRLECVENFIDIVMDDLLLMEQNKDVKLGGKNGDKPNTECGRKQRRRNTSGRKKVCC